MMFLHTAESKSSLGSPAAYQLPCNKQRECLAIFLIKKKKKRKATNKWAQDNWTAIKSKQKIPGVLLPLLFSQWQPYHAVCHWLTGDTRKCALTHRVKIPFQGIPRGV